MKKYIIICMVMYVTNSWSQRHIRMDAYIAEGIKITHIEAPSAYIDMYMKRAKLKNNTGPKLSYWKTGLFLKDSLTGITSGYNFDLMAEQFDSFKGRNFRHWNRLRMGMYIIAHNHIKDLSHVSNYLDLLDAELTISYLYIPRNARGDELLSTHRGYVELYASIRSDFDTYAYIGMKPWGTGWVRISYEDNHNHDNLSYRLLGISMEILLNTKGYHKGLTKTTKDQYKGLSLVIGSTYNLLNKQQTLFIGVRVQARNH
jgi:hypothetical protein